MDVLFHTTASVSLSLVIFALVWLVNRTFVVQNLKKTIIIIFFSCLLGGVFIDPIDHYRTNLNPIENLMFQFKVGVLDQPANLEKGRDDFNFNVFHNWTHLCVLSMIVLFLIVFVYLRNPTLAFYLALIMMCFIFAWSIHLYFDSFLKESWLCGQLIPKEVIASYYS